MRALLLALIMSLVVALPRAEAQQADIQAVITNQIEAFKKDDFGTAFTFAHPSIQGIFQTPENFGRMVAQGYPMVWRPSDVQYLSLKQESGRTLQQVQIKDATGKVFVLEYSMAETSDGWRINGVRILDSSAFST